MTTNKGKAKSQPKARVKHFRWRDLHYEKLNPLLHRQFVVGKDVMLAHIRLLTGCVVPKHSHYHEQISYIMEGKLKFSIGRREIVVRAGEVLAIPPHVPHKVEALRDSVSLDIFTPPREDWINKTDEYLRDQAKTAEKPAREAA